MQENIFFQQEVTDFLTINSGVCSVGNLLGDESYVSAFIFREKLKRLVSFTLNQKIRFLC